MEIKEFIEKKEVMKMLKRRIEMLTTHRLTLNTKIQRRIYYGVFGMK